MLGEGFQVVLRAGEAGCSGWEPELLTTDLTIPARPFAGVPDLLMLPVELKKPHAWVLALPPSLNRFELWLWHQDFLNPLTDYKVPAELETTPAAS